MEIRRYNRGEESAVWNVYFAATHESIARDYHADLIERWAPHDQDMSRWADRLAQKNPFVAVVDEEIVGMAEIEGGGFIDYFYVHPRWQKRGIGKALLATVESEATKRGVEVISADVSITAKSFFLSRGFCITEAKSNVILGHPAPNFRMQKRLRSEPDGAANGTSRFAQRQIERQRRLAPVADLYVRFHRCADGKQ
jgi:putative acetyltransferase